MPAICAVIGCSNKALRDDKRFFVIPSAIDNGGKVCPRKKQRREAWIKALRRKGLSDAKLKNLRICSDHFITGKPAKLHEKNHPDFIPNQKMDYKSILLNLDRYPRNIKRLKVGRMSTIPNEQQKCEEFRLPKEPKLEVQIDEQDPLYIPPFQEVKIEAPELNHVKIEQVDLVKIEAPDDEEVMIKEERIEEIPLASSSKMSGDTILRNTLDRFKTNIFQFKVTLRSGKSPKVWRRIQVPGNYTFRHFHKAIQKAMGWTSDNHAYHQHAFNVGNPQTGATDVIVTFKDKTSQTIDGDVKNEDTTPIVDYFTKLGQVATYEYHSGTVWKHAILFEKILHPNPENKYPRCLAGQTACPSEDPLVDSDEEFDPSHCFP